MIPYSHNPSHGRASSGKTAKQVALLIPVCLSLLLAGCSLTQPADNGSDDPAPQVSTPRVEEVTEMTGLPEATAQEPTAPEASTTTPREATPEAALRFEGGEDVRFSGVCSVGDARSVLTGTVPRRFEFRLDGFPLECNIENQGGGTLRVVLVAGGDTRSVQQSNGRGGTIRISYEG